MRDVSGFDFDSDDHLEVLAAAAHASWAGWTQRMLDILEYDLNVVGRADLIPSLNTAVIRWRRLIATPYVNLSEEREPIRAEVRKQVVVWNAYVRSGAC